MNYPGIHIIGEEFIGRKRKLDPVLFVFVLVFGVSSHLKPSLEEIYRHSVDLDDNPKITTSILNQSFRKHINNKRVDSLKSLLDYCNDQMVHQFTWYSKEFLEDFKDLLVQGNFLLESVKVSPICTLQHVPVTIQAD